MMDGLGNRFIFPAPDPSYGAQSYKRHLCWIPWNGVISPHRTSEETGGCHGIPCLWFPAPKAATVILFFHANAEDLGMSFAVLKHMRDQFKVNVLAVEYPGYGLLSGMTPSEDGVYEVALTTFRFLVDEISVRYSQIILFGRSLGSGPAVYLAAQYPVGGLILVSAFASIRAAVQSIVGRVFAWTFKERFPNNKIIANVSCSTLFIHGECDGLIPADHSLRLFKRCRARKLLITPPKMEHNSNLFGDASFLAVPAIHFFGFPGYYTSTPPRLPAALFENPSQRAKLRNGSGDALGSRPWLCDCLAKSDPHHLDVNFCRQEHSVEDITIRFFDGTAQQVQPPPQPQQKEDNTEVPTADHQPPLKQPKQRPPPVQMSPHGSAQDAPQSVPATPEQPQADTHLSLDISSEPCPNKGGVSERQGSGGSPHREPKVGRQPQPQTPPLQPDVRRPSHETPVPLDRCGPKEDDPNRIRSSGGAEECPVGSLGASGI
mmetsp:Transcript_75852/g.201530  ORF Transcript_75852/g.201530 Transcript_75852/m.201530 type:complete len:489 (-) Transcript_75852:131-1597(-)